MIPEREAEIQDLGEAPSHLFWTLQAPLHCVLTSTCAQTACMDTLPTPDA